MAKPFDDTDGESWKKLAQAMTAPLKALYNYQSVGRKTFDAVPACEKCGGPLEEGVPHPYEECVVRGVMET